jgi:hypothetical protein
MKKNIRIDRISQEIFQRLCGVSKETFEDMINMLEEAWHK